MLWLLLAGCGQEDELPLCDETCDAPLVLAVAQASMDMLFTEPDRSGGCPERAPLTSTTTTSTTVAPAGPVEVSEALAFTPECPHDGRGWSLALDGGVEVRGSYTTDDGLPPAVGPGHTVDLTVRSGSLVVSGEVDGMRADDSVACALDATWSGDTVSAEWCGRPVYVPL